MPSLKSLNLSIAILLHFHCWHLTPRCDLDLWPWTLVVYGLWRSKILYQIWVKSNYPRRSYGDLNIWPYDLEHVSSVPLCSEIIYTKFKLSQPIHLWNATIFYANTLCNAVTLTSDPLTLKTCGIGRRVSCGQTMYLWSRSMNARLSYWRFSNFLQGRGRTTKLHFSEGIDHTAPNLGRTQFHHRWTKQATLVPMRFFVSKWGRLKEE